jgi:Amt family ammonium transporter
MLGAGLLWFGWYGFNAGSATNSGGIAGSTFVTTTVATAAAMLAWLLTEKIRDGHPTTLGAASGIVAGLVVITPSCSSVNVLGALAIGAIGGCLCALAVGLKFKFGFDDSLDVVGVHLVGGLVGTVLLGFFATGGEDAVASFGTWYPEGALNGLFYGGGVTQLITQIVAALVAVVFSAVVTAIIAFALKFTLGWRISEEAEVSGIDLAVHGETAYENSGSTITEVR